MTARDAPAPFDIGHPAPGRHQVGVAALVVAFALAPLSWSAQLAALTSIAGLACLGEEGSALTATTIGWAGPAALWINLVALAVALVGALFSLMNLRRAQRAADAPKGGVMKAGEGRAHWMAVGGIFASILFLCAIAFNTISFFWRGLCPL